jgi:hypothetical protein
MRRTCSTSEKEEECIYILLVGKLERNNPLGRPRRKWVDNIKWILDSRMGWYGLDQSGSG